MKRFFAFGCSYTNYSWPTWADLLALEFDEYQNWAIPGLGNQAIFERLVEANVRQNFIETDVIIIQWSSHLRFDWYNRYSLRDRTSNWRTGGSIFSTNNEDILDKKWQYLFFDEFAYLMHTFNFISAAQHLLKTIGCRWYMTSIGDIRNIGFDLYQEKEYGEQLSKKETAWERFEELKIYEKSIWQEFSNHWIAPIQPHVSRFSEKFYTFKEGKNFVTDYHPSPRLFQIWLKECLEPKLNVNMDLSSQDLIVNSVDKMYEEIGKNRYREKFDEELQSSHFEKPKNMIYPNKYKGFY